MVTVWLRVPDVPVTVTVAAPAVAGALAAKVRVLVPAVLAGLKDAVRPFGRPDAARLTLLLKPYNGTTVRFTAPLPPCGIPMVAGEAERPKFGTAITRLIVVVWTSVPDVPVIVTVVVPTTTVEAAVKVRVLVPVVLDGLKDAVTPLGNPDAVRLTLPVKPFTGVIVAVLAAVLPAVSPTLVAERLKFGIMIVRLIGAVLFTVPETPVTVTVAVPAVAEAVATRVRVLVPAVLAGLKLAVIPLGRPDTVRLTVLLNPFWGFTVRVLEPLLPGMIVSTLGDAVKVKVGTTIVRLIDAVLFRAPEVPVTVTVVVPAVTELAATKVRVLALKVLAGLKVAVTPLGKPDTVRLTLLTNPFRAFTVKLLEPLLLGKRVSMAGDAAKVKVGTTIARLMDAVLFKVPEVPVTVIVAVPAVAELAATNARVLAPVVFTGLNDAVTPLGSPVVTRLTLPAKPFSGLTVSAVLAPLPGVRVRLAGEAERVKLGTVIVRLIVAVLFKAPDVPVIVIVVVPAAAELPAAKVRVLAPVVLAGLKDAVTPFGSPAAARLTLPLKPFSEPIAMVLTPLLPAEIERVAGDAASVNPGVAGAVLRSLIRDCPAGVPQPVTRS